MTVPAAPLWAQCIVAVLLVISGLLALLAGWGLSQLRDYFLRMHPPAIVTSGAAWCTSLAAVVYFSALHRHLALSTWLIIILLAITVPITNMLLARAALFRRRQQGDPKMPAPLQSQRLEE
ncbi:MAG: monovalent cation/H(+) antiporter subunit G [Brachymonas sp.]|nr:monovalent cation/H(+) antiporter subunit G [Brachymonas sp.]